MAKKAGANFEGWKSRVPLATREIAELIETDFVGALSTFGFERVYVPYMDPEFRVYADTILLERSSDDTIDHVEIGFAKRGAPRFQVSCGRRRPAPPYQWVRSANLVARPSQFYHYWGKPWWRPTWAWSTRAAEQLVRNIIGKTNQIIDFLEIGAIDSSISNQEFNRFEPSRNDLISETDSQK